MTGSMPDYRLYRMDGNRILGQPTVIDYASDQEAVEAARKQLTDRDIEVWIGARCVTRLKGQGG
jgi:hypothetical protein